MAEIYFVCTNKDCQPGRWGGDIIEIPEEHEEHINCPNCGQKYLIAEDKSVLTKFDEKPLVIDSFSGLNSLLEKYTLKRLFIETLHLKGISDNENFNKILSFDTCFIENLVIEDLDLKTTCTPIVFNGCYIDKITISNTRITEDEKKDFWGPFSFYGIVLNETEVFQQIEIDNFEGELMFKACDFSIPITVSNSKIHKINLVSNKKEPELIVQNSTIEEKLILPIKAEKGKIEGQPPTKKVADHVVKDSGNGCINLKNKHISNLSFEVKEEFGSSVKITNCIIENLGIRDQVFSQNIEFHNCLFLNPVLFSKATFGKMLCFESSNFIDDISLNEIIIGADFHLSYSNFAKNLNVHHTNISGFFNMHSALIEGTFNLERCKVNQNLTLVGSGFEKVVFNSTDFNHEVFFNTCRVNDLFTAKFLNVAGDFEYNKCTLSKDFDISTAKINGDIRITDSYLSENLNITLAEVKGDVILAQSTILGKVDFLLSKFSSLWLYSNRFASNFMKNQGSIEKTTQVINNIFYQQLILYQVTLTDSKLNNNYFLEKFDLDDIDCDDIVMDTNWTESLNMENVVCGKFAADGGIFNSISVSEIVCNKKFIFNSCSFYGEADINQSKFIRLVEFNDCVFEDSLTIEYNNLGSSLRFKNDDFKAKSDKCANLTIIENEISSSLQFEQMSLDGKTFIQKNNIGQELSIIYSKINPGMASEQEFSLRSIEKGLWIEQNNVVHNVQLKYLVCEAPVYFERNLVTGSLKIGGSKYETWFNKSVSFSKNRVRAIETDDCQFVENACFFNNHIEGGFVFGNSNFSMSCDASGSYAGGSALFANSYFKSELILDNAFFDKRLDFNNCYPDKL